MPTSAAERVYTHVRSRILDGAYPGGELLTEAPVADEVGVSRTPVREAMLRLETWADRTFHERLAGAGNEIITRGHGCSLGERHVCLDLAAAPLSVAR
jgi:hypothetical protein